MRNAGRNPVSVALDPENNRFVVRVASRTLHLSPSDFERLIEACIDAAAESANANFQERGVKPERNSSVEALEVDRMDGSTDAGASHVLTKVRLGVLSFNFACTRDAWRDYCEQVLRAIQVEDAGATRTN